jgi:hypothetical protein
LPEGYVRSLEKLWGIAIKEVDTIEDSILTALAGNEDSNKSVLNVWNDESKQVTECPSYPKVVELQLFFHIYIAPIYKRIRQIEN